MHFTTHFFEMGLRPAAARMLFIKLSRRGGAPITELIYYVQLLCFFFCNIAARRGGALLLPVSENDIFNPKYWIEDIVFA